MNCLGDVLCDVPSCLFICHHINLTLWFIIIYILNELCQMRCHKRILLLPELLFTISIGFLMITLRRQAFLEIVWKDLEAVGNI